MPVAKPIKKSDVTANAVVYARYSSHSQNEQSIEGQLKDAYEYAEKNGLLIVGEYIDRAQSARTDDRPSFKKMLSDAERRQFSVVLVWKLDRFARNRYDSAVHKTRLRKYGVRVVSIKENITQSPEGIILEGLLESMAEYYSVNLSENIKRGQRETTGKGLFCGGGVPYGYKAVDQRWVADERTAHIVRYLFSEYASGTPKKKIIDELSRRGVTGKRGGALTLSSFSETLRNPAYIGKAMRNGEVVEGLAEPLIDEKTFDAVQERLKMTARAPAAAKSREDYILRGKAFCGHCGAPMVGESGKGRNGQVFRYYACATRKKFHSCDKINEKKAFAEGYVIDQTLEYVLTPDRTEAIARAVVEEYNKEFSSQQIEEMEREIAQIDRELDKLVESIIALPKAALPAISAKMEKLGVQKEDLQQELTKLRIAHGIKLTEEQVIAWMRQFCKGDPDDPVFRQRLVDVFINSVYFYDTRVIIFYNIRGGKQVSYVDIQESDILASEEMENGSDLTGCAPPNRFKSETHFIFVNGVFGCIFYR